MSSKTAVNFFQWIEMITEELIIAKADADQDPTLEKHEYIEDLKKRILEAMR